MILRIKIEVNDNNIQQIFKVEAIKNANFVYYGENSRVHCLCRCTPPKRSHVLTPDV